jgi:hypothetical protein
MSDKSVNPSKTTLKLSNKFKKIYTTLHPEADFSLVDNVYTNETTLLAYLTFKQVFIEMKSELNSAASGSSFILVAKREVNGVTKVSFSSKPHVHEDLLSAKIEANRLFNLTNSLNDPNKRIDCFYVYSMINRIQNSKRKIKMNPQLEYIELVISEHQKGNIDAVKDYAQLNDTLISSHYERRLDEVSDIEYIRRCAAIDYEDVVNSAALYQDLLIKI